MQEGIFVLESNLDKNGLKPSEKLQIWWDRLESNLSTRLDIPIELHHQRSDHLTFASEYSIGLMEYIETPMCEVRWTDDRNRCIDEGDLRVDHARIEIYWYVL